MTIFDAPLVDEPATLTESMLRSAMEKIRDGGYPPPCGTAERPHVVHPNARGWTTCGNCFGPVEVREIELKPGTTTPTGIYIARASDLPRGHA